MKAKNYTLKRPLIMLLLLSMACILSSQAQDKSTEEILQGFVESYKTDNMAQTITFGVLVENDWWYVAAKRTQESYKVGDKKQYTFHDFSPHEVSLHKGKPSTPTWYFHFADKTVLDNIDQQKWTAATASAQSFGSDVVGLNIRDMDGFSSGIKEAAIAYEVMEHFWKKGMAEITYFKRDGSLPTHGVDHVGLYTMKDKRIGWFSIGPEQAANTERGLDKGQVPNLFIVTKGKGRAEFGDEVVDLEPGMSIFIPQYVKHVIYNPYKEPLEGIVVLFGDNIDYARGQSYMDFLELQHEFYQSYDQQITNTLEQ
ncbi:MAG: cupin domain-containing protein [Robiginitalea sp.]|uniref:cupin domain-containing protein n=1 Tax=Robiginitalea sp. TaxID=1902411 RepID=UPI003C78B749